MVSKDSKSESGYTRREWIFAINLSAFLGWAAITPWIIGGVGQSWFFWLVAAIIGLPIAFASTWLIGGPILNLVMKQPVSALFAATLGALLAGAMKIVFVVLIITSGLRVYFDPNIYSHIGDGNHTELADGIPTAYGWHVQGRELLIMMDIGAVVGLIVRAFIGPGKAMNEETNPKQ